MIFDQYRMAEERAVGSDDVAVTQIFQQKLNFSHSRNFLVGLADSLGLCNDVFGISLRIRCIFRAIWMKTASRWN